jgi:hypothetical protein
MKHKPGVIDKMRKLVATTILAVSALASTTALADAPGMASNVIIPLEAPERCMADATQHMLDRGFTLSFKVNAQSQAVSGKTDDATMWIRCLPEEKAVILVVAGSPSTPMAELEQAVTLQ